MIVVNGPTLFFGRAPSINVVLGSWFGLLFAIHGLYLASTPSPEIHCNHPGGGKVVERFCISTGPTSLVIQADRNVNFGSQIIQANLCPGSCSSDPTTLVQMQSDENAAAVAQHIEQLLDPQNSCSSENYVGIEPFWSDDIIPNFFANIGPFAKLQMEQCRDQHISLLQKLFIGNR